MRKAAKWADWLEARLVMLDVTKAGATPSMPTEPAPVADPSINVSGGYVPRSISFNTRSEGSPD